MQRYRFSPGEPMKTIPAETGIDLSKTGTQARTRLTQQQQRSQRTNRHMMMKRP